MSATVNIETAGELQIVSFKIGNEEYGINILDVQEINRMTQIISIPNTPAFIEGIVNLRGRIIPIVDLRTKLGLHKKETDNSTRIVVIDLEGKTIGFIVDSVSQVLRIPANISEPPPELISGVNRKFIKSVVKLESNLLILLELNTLFDSEEKTLLLKHIP
jgi:purine-binding chemotaxis protein CheW